MLLGILFSHCPSQSTTQKVTAKKTSNNLNSQIGSLQFFMFNYLLTLSVTTEHIKYLSLPSAEHRHKTYFLNPRWLGVDPRHDVYDICMIRKKRNGFLHTHISIMHMDQVFPRFYFRFSVWSFGHQFYISLPGSLQTLTKLCEFQSCVNWNKITTTYWSDIISHRYSHSRSRKMRRINTCILSLIILHQNIAQTEYTNWLYKVQSGERLRLPIHESTMYTLHYIALVCLSMPIILSETICEIIWHAMYFAK